MPLTFETLTDLAAHGRDTLIDVRTPAEFAEDHIPGAINLPALSNEQRVTVGTIYVQTSAFDGRKVGAAMVARNVADHLAGPLADHDGSWQPLVYCWRGGQRSGSFASILTQIGWRAETIKGGYQSFRKLVQSSLYDTPLPHRLILLDGNTGTAKTDMIKVLAGMGVQTLDLEGLANHRGSLLGGMSDGQPAQKAFETRLAFALAQLSPDRPVLVEAESSKIGKINLPPSLWAVMCKATRIMITAPLAARATYLATAYRDMTDAPEELRQRLQHLRRIRGHKAVDGWEALLQDGDHTGLAASLMQTHYDAAYAKSRGAKSFATLAEITADTLDDAGVEKAAAQIAELIQRET